MQALEPAADLGWRLERPGDVARPPFTTELELGVAGVGGDVGEQRLHCGIVGVRSQSKGLRIGDCVAQQPSRIWRIDRRQRCVFLHRPEKHFHFRFVAFAEQDILDAEAVDVDQEAGDGKPVPAGLAGQDHHSDSGLEQPVLHEAGVKRRRRRTAYVLGQSSLWIGRLDPASLRQQLLPVYGLLVPALKVS